MNRLAVIIVSLVVFILVVAWAGNEMHNSRMDRLRQAQARSVQAAQAETDRKKAESAKYAAEIKAANEHKLTKAKEKKAEDLKCRRNWECWANRHIGMAIIKCRNKIESLAHYDFQWTDGWLEAKFSHVKKTADKDTFTYIGDKIKFQQPNGSWLRTTYYCNYSPSQDSASAVRVSQGRIR